MKQKTWIGYLTLVGLLLTAVLGLPGERVQAQQPNQAALIVQHGDGRLITRCISFTEAEITGYDVLARSGLEIVTNFDSGMGGTICAIDGEGCPAHDCWCQCKGSPCVYWAYHQLIDGQWVYSNLGASNYRVQHGDVEGWAWGEGNPQGGVQPPLIPFEQICAPPATDTPIPATATATATATPIPATATSPPPPTATATPIPPPEAWFRLDQNPIPAGTCTMVRWDAAHAQAVYLDGESVPANGQREVCPPEPQTYRLRLVGAETEVTYELVLGVTGPTPSATPAATATPAAQASPTAAALSPTAELGPSPSPTPIPSPSPSPSPSASPPPSPSPGPSPTLPSTPTTAPPTAPPTSTPSPSPTPAPTQTAPAPTATPTPAPVAQAGPTLPPTTGPAPSEGDSSAFPVGYVVFGLIVVSLLGWLAFEARRRR